MSNSPLFSCCDCCFGAAKKTPEQQGQEVALLPPEKVFEFQQLRPVFSIHPQIPVTSKQPYTQSLELSNSFESSTGSHATSKSNSSTGSHATSKSDSKYSSHELVGDAHQNMGLLPKLEYSLYYDIQRRTLSVFLHQCCHLDPQGSSRGTINSYVVLFLVPKNEEVLESKVVERSLNPLFNQAFEFGGIQVSELQQQTLMFRIYRQDKLLSSTLIGTVAVRLDQADLYNQPMVAFVDDKMEEKAGSPGEVLFSLTFSPQSNAIQGILLKVANLQRKDVLGTIDPYVVVNLFQGEARKEKWKSTTKKGSMLVVYNEPFQFGIGSYNISDVMLEVVVMNYDRFGRNDVIGRAFVGLNVSDGAGRSHWSETLSSPEHAVSRWHILQSAMQKSVSK